MKKILTLLLITGMFAFVACSEEAEATEGDDTTEQPTNTDTEADTDVGEETNTDTDEDTEAVTGNPHACDATCETEGCSGPRHGEDGHDCVMAGCMAEEPVEVSSADEEIDV